jgi:hypothetical protein
VAATDSIEIRKIGSRGVRTWYPKVGPRARTKKMGAGRASGVLACIARR